MAHRPLTGVLLVGGLGRRFGGPKALARIGNETLAERAWRTLGEACDERIAVGKAGELQLPFAIHDDCVDARAPIAGVITGLRLASNELAVFLPVDCPYVTPELLRELGAACRDAAVPQTGPLPGAWARTALPVLERRLAEGLLSLRGAYDALDVVKLELDDRLLADADTQAELAALAGTP